MNLINLLPGPELLNKCKGSLQLNTTKNNCFNFASASDICLLLNSKTA